ncbi:MAG: tetratricopeptide repeat protein [Bacteroidetes bacterium]|jgi:signal transduction histidine kinase|nr:tetratricopeptide repeat protein [Bacteroidota bacterium]
MINRNILFIILICIVSNTFFLSNVFPKKDSVRNLIKNGLIESKKEKFDALNFMAANSQEADTILYYSNRAIALADKYNYKPTEAWVYKGTAYLNKGHLVEALEAFMHAAKLYQEENNSIGLATVYTYISSAYSSQENYTLAINYLNKAATIFKQENDSVRMASCLHNLGYEYYEKSRYDSSLMFYDKAKAIYHKLGFDIGIAYCHGNTGKVYSKLSDPAKAEKNLMKAIDLLRATNDHYAVTDFMIEYSNVLGQQGKFPAAIHVANHSFKLAEENQFNEFKKDAAYRLSQLYSQLHQYDSAYHYQGIYMKYKDSIQNIEAVQKMADLRTEFEVEQKQTEVDLLEKNRAIQRIVIGALMLIILLATGLIYIYYKNLIRTRKLNKELADSKEDLEIQQEQLRNLNHIKDKFFSIISHDLRGPISSFSGISMMIKESIEKDNREMLDEIAEFTDQTVVSLSGLLENLLNWALSQQGKFPFEMQHLNLKNEINEAVKYLSTIAISKNIQLEMHLTDNLLINADKNSFMTIIRNLLSNAFKFSHKNGTVKISAREINNHQVEIKVVDEGIGIPANKLNELFILNEAKSTRGTEQEKGIGLGLTLVYEFVHLNNGEIAVKSTEGRGTCFILTFDLVNNK